MQLERWSTEGDRSENTELLFSSNPFPPGRYFVGHLRVYTATWGTVTEVEWQESEIKKVQITTICVSTDEDG